MRKNIILTVMLFLLMFTFGCSDSGEVKVYDVTNEAVSSHEEVTVTAVIAHKDLEQNIGGVIVSNTYGDVILQDDVAEGTVVDVVYYSDTLKLVSIDISESGRVMEEVTKFTDDVAEGKAKYKGTSCTMSEFVIAIDKGQIIDVNEINTEDQVTLNFYNNVLVSVAVEMSDLPTMIHMSVVWLK